MRGREQVVPIQEKFLITVPEAAKYFGIGTKQMRHLAENHLSDFAIFMGN
ncbi:excisionase, partial [Klebsiella pneumoniae]|nr:excisionase [Klebsiella pneumoniae]